MEIRLTINVFTASNKTGLVYTKSYESSTVPTIGSKIKDSLFAELKLVEDVVFNYQEDLCIVYLESKEMPDGRIQDGHVQEVAALHNWILVENK